MLSYERTEDPVARTLEPLHYTVPECMSQDVHRGLGGIGSVWECREVC